MLSRFPGVVVIVVIVVIVVVEFIESTEFCGSCALLFRSTEYVVEGEEGLNRDVSPFSLVTDSLYVGGLSRLLDEDTAFGSSYIG